ncbi:hypothetical protein [Veronia pacifica]|uniref:Uncharacterized protein n=1 Tax=Veronia pacifica TaxID=1080227 RepID=A0A1C3EBN7_9GAMM|nr:hypothetical protein [Veronia pacifica]ODA30645.1 hypothetical protein A8L45_19785 [Veronia pacifica]
MSEECIDFFLTTLAGKDQGEHVCLTGYGYKKVAQGKYPKPRETMRFHFTKTVLIVFFNRENIIKNTQVSLQSYTA